jgi:hypothetical protein
MIDLKYYESQLAAFIQSGSAALNSSDVHEVVFYVVAAAKREPLTALAVGQALFGAFTAGHDEGHDAAFGASAFMLRNVARTFATMPDEIEAAAAPAGEQFRAFVQGVLQAVYDAGIKAGQAGASAAPNESSSAPREVLLDWPQPDEDYDEKWLRSEQAEEAEAEERYLRSIWP